MTSRRLSVARQSRLPLLAVGSLLIAFIVVVATGAGANSTTKTVIQRHIAAQQHDSNNVSASAPSAAMQRFAPVATAMDPAHAAGQLVIAGYSGDSPPADLLRAIRGGEVGAVMLLASNTDDSVGTTGYAVQQMQTAAAVGHNPGLLVLAEQEEGNPNQPSRDMKVLKGAPTLASAQMSDPDVASRQGRKTASLLKTAGVNVDLGPVADFTPNRSESQRGFGTTPASASQSACGFAAGLASGRIAYTLKQFPGLGDSGNANAGSGTISEPVADLRADTAAYRECGSKRLALIMVASASYPAAGVNEPAVLDPSTYDTLLAAEGLANTVTISGSFSADAIWKLDSPARRAIDAGLDMVMYPGALKKSLDASETLTRDITVQSLDRKRVDQAVERILALKHALGLST